MHFVLCCIAVTSLSPYAFKISTFCHSTQRRTERRTVRIVISGTSLSSAPTFEHILHRCIDFKLVSDSCLLLPLLVVVYQIQPSNLVELQQHSPLSNNTSVTSYVYRMIISPPYLFKHKKNNDRVAMIFQCLLYHTQQKF